MRGTGRRFAVLAIAVLAAIALSACAPTTPTAVDAAKEQVDQKTEQKQASVDATLNSAQDKLGELAKSVGGLEARVNGLQVNSDLQEVQRKLTNAIGESGAKKKDALDALSTSFNDLIAKVEAAAAQLPEGGAVQTELTDFATQLRAVQTSLAEAAASYDSSATATP